MAPFQPTSLFARDSGTANTNNILATCISCTVLIFIFLGTRLLSKRIKHTKLDWDDAMLVASSVIALGQNTLYAWASYHCGLGHDGATWDMKEMTCIQKGLIAVTIIQPSSLALAKLSLLYLLNKIFHVTRFRIAIQLLMAIVILWWLGASLSGLFICWPINSRWNPTVKGHCGDQELLLVAVPIPWVITDFAILVAPMFVVGTLQLPLGKKLAVMGMFAIGGLTCIITCIRYAQVFKTGKNENFNYTPLAVWSMAESSTTIICVSLIASKPVLKLLVPETLLSRSTSWLRPYLSRKDSNGSPSGKRSTSWIRSFFGSSKSSSRVPSEGMHPLEESSLRSLQFQTEHPSARSGSGDSAASNLKGDTSFNDSLESGTSENVAMAGDSANAVRAERLQLGTYDLHPR